jgi:aminocarboxymuconate-semialdehyde decarboxylase
VCFRTPAAGSKNPPIGQKALKLCQILNDAFAEAHAKYPNRFMAFARLPMIDMEDCTRELERCYKDLKMHGVMMPTNVAGKYIDEPEFKPFWDALAQGDKPLFIHPANAPCHSNWDKYSLHQKILWPTDSTLALSRIVYAGILDRYPQLKMIASHLGGMILLLPGPAQLARRRSGLQGRTRSLFQKNLLRYRRTDSGHVHQARL